VRLDHIIKLTVKKLKNPLPKEEGFFLL